MNKVIVYTNENGGVNVTYPTPEFLETNTIEDVMAKDCPNHAIIIDESDLPQGEDAYFDAWELVDGKVIVNLDKKNAIMLLQESEKLAKQSAVDKLKAMGLTEDEIKAIKGVA
jgi:hypothetical protein